jgi:hypothetical protein
MPISSGCATARAGAEGGALSEGRVKVGGGGGPAEDRAKVGARAGAVALAGGGADAAGGGGGSVGSVSVPKVTPDTAARG